MYEILKGLSDLREEGTLCDIELQAEGKTISAHRVVLASVSPYFKALFTGGFKEANQKVINLKEVSFNGLKTIIDCCYSIPLDINTDNLSDILATATMVQINDIVDHCSDFMSDNVAETPFLFAELAEKFSLHDVRQKAIEYIFRYFYDARKGENFKKLSKDALIEYLSHDALEVRQESHAFYAAKDWLEYDPERMKYAEEVLSHVRFHAIDIYKLAKIVEINLIEDNKFCRSLVREALVYNSKELDFAKPMNNDERARPRGREGIFVFESLEGSNVKEDGWKSSSQSFKDNNIYLFSLDRDVDRFSGPFGRLSRVGKFVRNSISMMEVNKSFLFLFATDNETFEPVTMRFESSKSEWMSLKPAPIPYDRQAVVGSSIAMFHDEIDLYLISGMLVSEHSDFQVDMKCSKKLLRYEIVSNEWEVMPDIPTGSYYSAAVACSSNECIYVCGGSALPHTGDNRRTFAFDTNANMWLSKPPMKYGRHAHCVGLIQDKIYAVGGYQAEGRIEFYDIVLEQWTELEDLVVNVIGSCAIVKDDTILILGGKANNERTSDILVFNPQDQKVTLHEKSLPKPMWCPVGALIISRALH